MGETNNDFLEVSTEELFCLYRDLRRIFPSTTIEDFGEIVEDEGYWETRQRINIQTDSVNELRKMWVGKGIFRIRELWKYFTTNQFNKVIDKDLIKLSKRYKESR